MTTLIESYVEDRWIAGEGAGRPLTNPVTGEVVAIASTDGLDLRAALDHARRVGGPALRGLGFEARGAILKALSGVVRAHREELLELSRINSGSPAGDGAFDIDGASGTLHFYAGLARSLGEGTILPDGDPLPLGRDGRLVGRHVWVPRRGAAILINAFNFPAWGFAEKMACAVLAGLPVVVKPATATALVSYRLARLFVESGALPEGSWTFLGGSAGDLLDHVEVQDVVAFTGSAATARAIRSHPRVVAKGVRVNVEADSLNAAVLGPDVAPGSTTWDLFLDDVVREMTQKTGQKCTATRRIVVPSDRLGQVREALTARLAAVGPMGPLVSVAQRAEVGRALGRLREAGEVVYGDPDLDDGCFLGPVLLEARAGVGVTPSPVHEVEAFGPVATLLPYDGSPDGAAGIVSLAEGTLVTSLYSDDTGFVAAAAPELAPYTGRLVLGSEPVAEGWWSPGVVLPGLVHGGPGRAGGGEELGGVRGLELYMQRVAFQGHAETLAGLLA